MGKLGRQAEREPRLRGQQRASNHLAALMASYKNQAWLEVIWMKIIYIYIQILKSGKVGGVYCVSYVAQIYISIFAPYILVNKNVLGESMKEID